MDEEGQQTPQPMVVARKRRQATPDHPPYCWMIGEATDALAEDGGSEEDSISAFIRARHPGVPPAHDRLLRHYLGKHVAEGFFVRTATGRFERSPQENADEELPVEQADQAGSCKPASVGSSVVLVEAKRGRGRPRKDGSPSTLAVAAMSSVAVAGKDEVHAPSLKPKRRGRPRSRRQAGADHRDKEHEPPRELALVILGDSSAAPIMDKPCTTLVPPTTPPVDGGQPIDLALATTTEVPVPEPAATPAMDKDGADADASSIE